MNRNNHIHQCRYNSPHPENLKILQILIQTNHNMQKWIVLTINDLSAKTHENTGNKPAKQEIKNKHNMNPKPPHPYLQCKQESGLPLKTLNLFQDNTTAHILKISFSVDYIYGRHGSRFPTGELIELIFIATINRAHQNAPNQPANTHKLRKRIPLIINELNSKTHETTGK